MHCGNYSVCVGVYYAVFMFILLFTIKLNGNSNLTGGDTYIMLPFGNGGYDN